MENNSSSLEGIPNIGKVLAKQLEQIGVFSLSELQALGAEQVFIRIKTIDPGACLSALCALEGAVQGVRWHYLDNRRKLELNEFYKMTSLNIK